MWLKESQYEKKVISEKPYIVVGSCLDCWQTGSRMDKRCAIHDKVLLNFVRYGGSRNPVGPKGATFCLNTSRMLKFGDRRE